ncbi:23S rRNA (uracil(1939)-C(5))-methyltransferase RlmD [Ohessyouella blattaphilus]|uniref:23S rRNA (Uracil(1939)-C(5))-methyltransferase RlmD n=1 Tax=Ohessyouella blattaphilus TaxID=2949333 RepID=A0ABT1EHV6_9FIRM|nr:23S rRNA (uracil(1939)-C(5))-methyltransferase RlmD [Ohessyouella blattaphilus]MCP1110275.1 23S rRNA (uracil(1939)-C(5))-methyltransferase RlmD [Ohessyouella blattaphilus]MCR8563669.1 23S rRNA (uracil(1939)-C(5))-methyltransferase RlmD [Ohessyouella blattaphilus]
MKKNDIVEVEITDCGINGEGIGKLLGFPLFIKDALIGDTIQARITKVKKNYAFARLEKIITPAKERITPPCPVAAPCGGCQIQALSYPAQLTFKEKKVKDVLMRLGKVPEGLLEQVMEPIIGMNEPYRYRNKAQYPFGTDKEGNLIAGFYAGRTHHLVTTDDCLIGAKENKDVLDVILRHARKHHIAAYDEETRTGLLRHVLIRKGTHTGEIMVCPVINGKTYPKVDSLIEELTKLPGMTCIALSINTQNTNVIMGEEIQTLWGTPYITDKIGDLEFRLSPLSFFQVNSQQTEKLYQKALDYAGLTGNETIWDIYCGIGTITCFLARKAKQVYGIEVIPEAIEDAKENAKLNNIDNIQFYAQKAEDELPKHKEDKKTDIIVVDPPRKGLDEKVLETIIYMEPKKIVYVSCDPATLARDIKYLREHGYELEHLTPVDMFPHTVHVETIVSLQRTDT